MSGILRNISGSRGLGRRGFLFFSFNELLVVLFILSAFSSLAIPLMMKIRSGMKKAVCTDALMKINRLCLRYSEENGYFPPASPDRDSMWFGLRYDTDSPFQWTDAPISRSLSYKNRFVPICPEMYQLLKGGPRENEHYGFGYGYNENVGSLRMLGGDMWSSNVKGRGLEISRITDPKSVMLFSDTATKVDAEGARSPKGDWAMYPFAEPYSYYNRGQPVWGSTVPSVHFRHSGKANVSWCDGHVSTEKLEKSRGAWGKSCIGYLGPDDDKYFKPF